jgi:PadR family transcriptional regulator, regulatory protein PadR
MKPIRLTTTTLQVLEVLCSHEEQVYGLEIATKTGLMTGTVYPILARLERAGWVIGKWDTSDESRGPRKRFYQLTPQAREESEALLGARAASREQAVARAARLRAQHRNQ